MVSIFTIIWVYYDSFMSQTIYHYGQLYYPHKISIVKVAHLPGLAID